MRPISSKCIRRVGRRHGNPAEFDFHSMGPIPRNIRQALGGTGHYSGLGAVETELANVSLVQKYLKDDVLARPRSPPSRPARVAAAGYGSNRMMVGWDTL